MVTDRRAETRQVGRLWARIFWSLSAYRLPVLVLFGVAFAAAAQPRMDVDLGWHLRTGQLIWDTGSIPHNDPYSFTVAGQPWITHEWLSEVIMWPFYATWGHAGLMVLCSTAIVLGLLFVYRQMRSDGTSLPLAAALLFLGGFSAWFIWGTRPLVVTLCLAPLYALLLRRWWLGSTRALLPLAPLMVIWVNLHGGYMFGLGLVAVYLLGGLAARWLPTEAPRGSLRSLAIVGTLCVVATLANPNTYEILWYPFDTLTSAAMREYLGDWPSPNFHEIKYWPFGLMLTLFFVAAARDLRRMAVVDLLLVLALGGMALQSNRHVPLFALITTPVLARQIGALGPDLRSLLDQMGVVGAWQRANRPVVRSAVVTAATWLILAAAYGLLGASVADSLSPKSIDRVQQASYPVFATQFIQEHRIQGRIYNAYNWGGYLVLNFYPEQRVFIDSRADVYRDSFIEEYLETYYIRPRWRETLDKYAVQFALLENQGPLHILLRTSAEWREIYSDDVAVLLERISPPAPESGR